MKANWILCLVAGLVGGVISHFAWATPVRAQALSVVPQQVRAQSFVIVDERDKTTATLRVTQSDGREVFEIVGNDGEILARVSPGAHIIE